MKIELSAHEARVIGCLIEKQITTPDQYPLSLNALANACNQKSNRDPLMSLDEQTVQQVVDGLVRKHMVIEKSGFGSRVPKFQHIFCNTEFGSLKFTPLETAIVCELLLRGPQMPGELRTRAQRMAPVGEVSEVEAALRTLAQRPEGPIVVQLPREAGRRDSRYAHLFSGDIDLAALAEAQSQSQSQSPIATPSGSATGGNAPEAARGSLERLERLEKSVQELRAELDALKVQLGEKRFFSHLRD